ncbi:hypothetical protein ACPOL_1102 [Acidisarcina polymorpha]|uniref:Uncharacterized protein n=1 Tax=Acidisarcina polymorpha TaxID=2211140 RepID=A0A2Z5FUC0_9BACT|nr:hypothetical protein ACPOL_1102 [Acidisarcina polymorpha]
MSRADRSRYLRKAGSIHLRVGVSSAGDWMFDNEIDWVNKLQG